MIETRFKNLLSYLNTYANSRSMLTTGCPWSYKYIYENNNYYRINKFTKEKTLTTKEDIADDFKLIGDTKLYDNIIYRLK